MRSPKELEEHFETTLARDLRHMIVGDHLGSGSFRTVCEYKPDPTCVIKFENGAHSFENALESEVWKTVEMTKHAGWFAPVVSISQCGVILLMRKTNPIPERRLPKMVPAFFTDLKPDNWGFYKGRPVCHDYGRNLLMEKGMTNRMRKANWS